MKTATLARKKSKILLANNRTVRHQGKTYLIRSQSLGPLTLADAEPLPEGGAPINLFPPRHSKEPQDKLGQELRGLVESGLFS